MNNTITLLFILLISCFSFQASAQSCTRVGQGDIIYKDANGNIIPKYAPGPNREKPTSQWVEKCEPKVTEISTYKKKEGPTDEQCDDCTAKNFGPQRKTVCGEALGCSSFQILFLNFQTAKFAPVVAACEGSLTCSAETKECEYTCPEGFEYNISSGDCEKPCAANEILADNICQACPAGKKSQNNQCVDECEIEGQTKVNGACACPANQVVVNNACQEAEEDSGNPCTGGQMPYNGVCKSPLDRVDFKSPCLNSNCFTEDLSTMNKISEPNGEFSYLGCRNDNGVSSALFTILGHGSEVYKYSSYAFGVHLYCADGNSLAAINNNLPISLGSLAAYSETQSYFSAPALNSCYKYRAVLLDGYSIYDYGTINVPYIDCSSCPSGMIKSGSGCACPQGHSLDSTGKCSVNIRCVNVTDYRQGKCECGNSNPYYLKSLSSDYTCAQPTFDRMDESTITQTGKVSISASVTGCWDQNPELTVSATSSLGVPTSLTLLCVDKSFSQRDPSLYTGVGFGPSLGSVSSSAPFNKIHRMAVDPGCYKYKVVAVDQYSWAGVSPVIELKYNQCPQ